MQTLVRYTRQQLNEGLKPDIKKFFDSVAKSQEKLIKDNKPVTLTIDTKNIKKPKHSFKIEDFQDESVQKIIDNKKTGFGVTSQMFKNSKKYFKVDDKDLKVESYPYFYVDEKKKVYMIGISMFDTSANFIDGFIHLVGIESALCVENGSEICKFILKNFCVENKGKFKGITAKPTHPKIKGTLAKLGFASMKDDPDTMTYKLK